MNNKDPSYTIVPEANRHIVASGGENSAAFAVALFNYLVGLSTRQQDNQQVLFITAEPGDESRSFALPADLGCASRHLSLADCADPDALRALLLSQDIIFVGDGDARTIRNFCKAKKIDLLLKEAWSCGIVLAGSGAGAVCLFDSGVTLSSGSLAYVDGCLGIIKGSFCPHYDLLIPNAKGWQATYHNFLHWDILGHGYGVTEGAALHFAGAELTEVITGNHEARAFRVTERGFTVSEQAIESPLIA